MTKQKSTKRALLMSALSLLMCVSMLIGSTFAWFTDSVTSGRNKIVAGNLDVVLEYKTPDSTDWAEVTSDTVLFSENSLWEPGHTEVVALRIRNAGTLALKYDLATTVYKEKAGTNKDGDTFLLSDYLEVGYSAVQQDNAVGDMFMGMLLDSRKNAASLAGSGFGESAENPNPVIAPGEAHVCALAVTMPETVGNEANYMTGTEAPFISFGVTLLATQATVEIDSFGSDYDKDAEYPVIDADGLADAIAEGKDVKLEADVALTETIAVDGDIAINLNGFDLDASDNTSRPFELADGATLTINGGDEEVDCGAYGLVNIPAGNDATVILNGGKYMADTDSGSFIKPRGDGEITIVLKDVEYIDSSANGYALDCTAYTGDDLNVVIEDCKFEATVGLILPEGASVKGTEITVNNTKNMQPAVYATGDMTIENCIIKAAKSHAVAVAGGATLTVKNCEVYAGTDANALAFQVFSSGGTIDVYETTYVGEIGTTGKMNTGRVAIINIDGVEAYRKG